MTADYLHGLFDGAVIVDNMDTGCLRLLDCYLFVEITPPPPLVHRFCPQRLPATDKKKCCRSDMLPRHQLKLNHRVKHVTVGPTHYAVHHG